MKRRPYLAVLLLLPLLAFQPGSSSISYETKYRDAMRKAQMENKLIFMVVCDDNCAHCKRYKREVLNDWGVSRYINDNFVPIYIDPSTGVHAFRLSNWGITTVPTTLIMSPDRKMKKIRTGYQTTEDILAAGDEAYAEFNGAAQDGQALK